MVYSIWLKLFTSIYHEWIKKIDFKVFVKKIHRWPRSSIHFITQQPF